MSLIAFSNCCQSQEGAREVREVFSYRLLKNIVCVFGRDASKFVSPILSLFSGLYFFFVWLLHRVPATRFNKIWTRLKVHL